MFLQDKRSFIEPYYIEELGCYGLTAADIAKSLDAEPKHIREKLRNRIFSDTLETLCLRAVEYTTPNKTNGLQYEEIALETQAAKFFVARYESVLGALYLKFLLDMEKKAQELEALTESDPLLRYIAATARLRQSQIHQERQLKEHSVAIEDLKEVQLDSILSVPQKKNLKELIDAKGYSLGSAQFIGSIQKDLKKYFGLNTTNDRWYHIKQRDYEAAISFVSRWGLQP